MLRTVVRQLASLLSESSQPAISRCLLFQQNSQLHTTAPASEKRFDREKHSVRQKGGEVAKSASTDGQHVSYNKSYGANFATLETHGQVFNGVPYSQLPVIHIKATSNNTIISLTDGDGVVQAIQSAGTVGFRNARKGTNVAAQAAALALADNALRKEVKQARLCLRGIGPGRLPALKAVEMAGIQIVSITDTTPLAHNGNRPKKVRRL